MKKYLFLIFVFIFVLEGGGYIFGVQPSDIFYHYLFFKSDSEENKKFGSLVSMDFDSGVHEDFIELNKIESKYRYSIFFSSLLSESKRIPDNILYKNLNKIYVVDSVSVGMIPAAGAYGIDQRFMYLSNKRKDGTYVSKRSIKSTFHHELSSILMKSYGFDEALWRASAGEGFLYKNDEDPFYYAIYMQGDADKIEKEVLYNRGLLRQYAETGVENDFNIYASKIFTEPREMKLLVSKYPIIKRKYNFFKEFYLSIDQGFAPVFEAIDG